MRSLAVQPGSLGICVSGFLVLRTPRRLPGGSSGWRPQHECVGAGRTLCGPRTAAQHAAPAKPRSDGHVEPAQSGAVSMLLPRGVPAGLECSACPHAGRQSVSTTAAPGGAPRPPPRSAAQSAAPPAVRPGQPSVGAAAQIASTQRWRQAQDQQLASPLEADARATVVQSQPPTDAPAAPGCGSRLGPIRPASWAGHSRSALSQTAGPQRRPAEPMQLCAAWWSRPRPGSPRGPTVLGQRAGCPRAKAPPRTSAQQLAAAGSPLHGAVARLPFQQRQYEPRHASERRPP